MLCGYIRWWANLEGLICFRPWPTLVWTFRGNWATQYPMLVWTFSKASDFLRTISRNIEVWWSETLWMVTKQPGCAYLLFHIGVRGNYRARFSGFGWETWGFGFGCFCSFPSDFFRFLEDNSCSSIEDQPRGVVGELRMQIGTLSIYKIACISRWEIVVPKFKCRKENGALPWPWSGTWHRTCLVPDRASFAPHFTQSNGKISRKIQHTRL